MITQVLSIMAKGLLLCGRSFVRSVVANRIQTVIIQKMKQSKPGTKEHNAKNKQEPHNNTKGMD